MGPVPLTQAHPALAERLRTSTPGVLNPPFRLSEWTLVMRLESYTPASFDDATAQQMAEELFYQWVNEETTRRDGRTSEFGRSDPGGMTQPSTAGLGAGDLQLKNLAAFAGSAKHHMLN